MLVSPCLRFPRLARYQVFLSQCGHCGIRTHGGPIIRLSGHRSYWTYSLHLPTLPRGYFSLKKLSISRKKSGRKPSYLFASTSLLLHPFILYCVRSTTIRTQNIPLRGLSGHLHTSHWHSSPSPKRV